MANSSQVHTERQCCQSAKYACLWTVGEAELSGPKQQSQMPGGDAGNPTDNLPAARRRRRPRDGLILGYTGPGVHCRAAVPRVGSPPLLSVNPQRSFTASPDSRSLSSLDSPAQFALKFSCICKAERKGSWFTPGWFSPSRDSNKATLFGQPRCSWNHHVVTTTSRCFVVVVVTAVQQRKETDTNTASLTIIWLVCHHVYVAVLSEILPSLVTL